MMTKLEQSISYVIQVPVGPASRKTTMKNDFIRRFLKDDRGEHAIEFLMILTFGVLPLIAAVYLLEEILQEYVAFGQIFVSSPFF